MCFLRERFPSRGIKYLSVYTTRGPWPNTSTGWTITGQVTGSSQKSVCYHLKNTESGVKGLVSQQDVEELVRECISSRPDYSDGVIPGLPKTSSRYLQQIQNAAARVLTRTQRVDHTGPVLRFLLRLPVRQRTGFKILFLVNEAPNGSGTRYFSELALRVWTC